VDDRTYQELLDYAHVQSKKAMRNVGVGRLIRQMITNELTRLKSGHAAAMSS
jgi:hypothetical protein